MPLYINTNVSSLRAQKNLSAANSTLQTSFQRLSSGYRINSAADDAAGMAISESLRAQIRSFSVAERNANNAISMANTAEGGLGEVSNMIIRMRELAVQAASEDLQSADRDAVDLEFQALIAEIDRVSGTTEFNGVELLSGAATTVDFQVGIGTGTDNQISVSFGDVTTGALSIDSIDVTGTDSTNALAAITALDAALTTVSGNRATLGAATNRLMVAASNSATMRANLSAANSSIRDVDVAAETAVMARSQVLVQAASAVLSQANAAPQLALSLLR